jgi:hypothetical protein
LVDELTQRSQTALEAFAKPAQLLDVAWDDLDTTSVENDARRRVRLNDD